MVVSLHYKSDGFFSVFCTFKAQIENLISSKIKKFRTDGEGEFLNSKFRRPFQTSGIIY